MYTRLIVKFSRIRRLLGEIGVTNLPVHHLLSMLRLRRVRCQNCRFTDSYLVAVHDNEFSPHRPCCSEREFSKRLKENGKQIGIVHCITPPWWSMRKSRSRIKLCLCRQTQRGRRRTSKAAGVTARARPLFSAEVFRHPDKESLYNSLSWLPFSI